MLHSGTVLGVPCGSVVKNPPANAGDTGLIPGVGKIPWRREWQPTSVFLPGEFPGQRSLVGYSPWGRKESDPAKRLSLGLPRWFSGERISCNAGDLGLIPGEGRGNPFQYSGESQDRGAWWATVHGVTKSQTQLK